MVIVLDTKLNSFLKVFNSEFSPWFSSILRKTWIPKSTDNPMNKTAKATDIKLREPIVKDVIPVVIKSPIIIDKIKQKISLIFLRLAKSIILTRIILNNPLSAAPFDTDLTSS